MKIIVTGSAGFIGSALCKELRKQPIGDGVWLASSGHEVVTADIKTDGNDLRDPDKVEHLFYTNQDADVCIHLAAKVGRLNGENNVTETILDNVAMTALIAKACGQYRVRMVYTSTSEMYGDTGEITCDEDFGPFELPHNAYGLSKRQGEEFARLYAPDGCTILRPSMPYGPGVPAGYGRAAIVNMLHQAFYRQPIPVHRGAERSWCWIGDTVRAIRMIVEQTDGGVFNVGRDDDSRSMWEVAEIACDLTGAPRDLIMEVDVPERQTAVKRLGADKIRALGWEPTVELEQGMAVTLGALVGKDALV